MAEKHNREQNPPSSIPPNSTTTTSAAEMSNSGDDPPLPTATSGEGTKKKEDADTVRESKRRKNCPSALEKIEEFAPYSSNQSFSFTFDTKLAGCNSQFTPKFGSFNLPAAEQDLKDECLAVVVVDGIVGGGHEKEQAAEDQESESGGGGGGGGALRAVDGVGIEGRD